MNKSKKNNNNLLIYICAAVVVVVVVVVAIVLATKGGGINDSYFVSDGTKYVLTLDQSDVSMEDSEYNPEKAHLVYTYSGDEITGLKAYYVYANADSAKKAAEYLETNFEKDRIAVDGKYVIYTAPTEEYESLTASDVKQQIEFMELLKNYDSEDYDDTEEGYEEDYEEDYEETDEE